MDASPLIAEVAAASAPIRYVLDRARPEALYWHS